MEYKKEQGCLLNVLKIGNVPKIFWMYWDSGLENAPFLVQKIVEKWKSCLDESWEIKTLDKKSVWSYVDIALNEKVFSGLSKAHQADLIRLQLLYRYGGVWCDATVYCNKDPNVWMNDELFKSGFFAFEKPADTRAISNWFLAAEKENYIIARLLDEFVYFFENNNFMEPGIIRRFLKKRIGKWVEKGDINRTNIWFSKFVLEYLNIYPYFVFHYIFNRLLNEDRVFCDLWEKTPKISAEPMHKLKKYGIGKPVNREIMRYIEDDIPVFKLDWKMAPENFEKDTVLYELFMRKKQKGLDREK